MTKKVDLETLNSLPLEFDSEELFERLILIEKINKGLHDVEAGRTISLQESKMKMQDR